QYESVTLKGLWPGIDLRCYSTDGTLETDWLVAAGADYSQIRFEVKGAELSTDDEGHLIMGTPFGEIREGGLKVFQEGQQLEARWVIAPLEGEVPGGAVSFEVMGHDPMLAMRIDPMVQVWGTFYGGSYEEEGRHCIVDSEGSVFLAGWTQSQYPLTAISSGGHQAYFGDGTCGSGSDCPDAFLVKFTSEGVRLWGTYYGGDRADEGHSCAVDSNDDVYLAGFAGSTYAIASNGHQNTIGGGEDAFLVKFNESGVRLWGTYYGGDFTDQGFSCAVDMNDNVYLAGKARSETGIASQGHQETFGGYLSDAMLVKFNSNGVRLWATYFGGSQEDIGYACATDNDGSVYLAGKTSSTDDIASGGHQNTYAGSTPCPSNYCGDAFLAKFSEDGVRQWSTYYGGGSVDEGRSCAIDNSGNIYLAGTAGSIDNISWNGFQNSLDGAADAFIAKFNPSGNRLWATYFGSYNPESGYYVHTDDRGGVYLSGTSGTYQGIAYNGYQNTFGGGSSDAFMAKFNSLGQRQWATYFGANEMDYGFACATDSSGHVYFSGQTKTSNTNDSLLIGGHQTNYGGWFDAFLVKFKQPELVNGSIWLDLNANCIKEEIETGVVNEIPLLIQPGDIVSQSQDGIWSLDSLPTGTYTISVDTTNPNWILTCPPTQTFTVTDSQSMTEGPSFGFISTNPCPSPVISIVMLTMRRGFSNQMIHVSACNEPTGTDLLADAYCIVQLDENISVQSASMPYTPLDNNLFQFDLGDINPGQCVEFTLRATVELTAEMNQTLCLSAELYPQPECVFDTVPDPYPPTVTPCDATWDGSSLTVEAHCDGDSVYFTVTNLGADMACYAPVRVYVNGNQVILDSLMLAGGDSAVFTYLGNGQTWRLEADQHPYHPGNSNPSAHMEICGSSGFLPFVVTMFPQDDADPVIDIFCDQVSAPYDPNDKTGSPRGLGETHAIQRGQQIEYLVRFQNIGTDTAVNVVILDTLTTDLNIFTVQSGVSSHPYEFRMYGPRVLEWRFNNILLPDSTTDELGSNGFVAFKVQQVPDLPYGTVIENTANIYFDFEEPVITNTYYHTVTPLAGTAASVSHDGSTVICGEGSIILTAPLGNAYLWNTGDTVQTIVVEDDGEFWVTVDYVDGSGGTTPAINISTAQNPTVVMTEVEEGLNILSAPVELEGTPPGGTFAGTAVSGNMFDPSEAGLGEHCITYTYTDGVGCAGADVHCVTVDFAVGVGEERAVTFTVFPNPGNGLLTLVTSAEGLVRLTVKDISGREVLQESYTATAGTARSIDLSDQANGIYTLRIETEKGTGGVKLVKE
ncbi:MAG: SBBP repeat-containing protein, partial [Flavobacteriales bacterium]|nr:SBBP repeat-containing protein [Flavobacteriales bacterium]